ncbi:MAG: hypothetical protein IJ249_00605 [Paludibacteraceae bacterium]|nr:hypothetical protein [Paludibacteraceae bacterium]
MEGSKRIILNTSAQYTRTIINTCLSLYSTRFILRALGEIDYGVYFVVAGVITLFAFLTNASVITTQRYISYYIGQGDHERIRSIYGNSMLLHAVIAICIVGLMLIGCYPIIYHGLNIPPERMNAAAVVYIITAVMFFFSIILAPIRALFIARENITYISIVDVLDGVLKFGFAYALLFVTYDRLIVYALMMFGIQVLNMLVFSVYADIKFPEFHWPRLREWNKGFITDLSSFAGWTLYSSGCVVARNQGIAIILNVFFGAAINAAYGIAMQVSGAVSFISSSIINAINPQLVKAEGANNRQKMLKMAEYESKYAFLLLSFASIPLIFEMDGILKWWLGSVPEHAVAFCQLTLLAAIFDQLSIGLTSAVQAIGDLKIYTLVFYTTKLLTLLAIWGCIKMNLSAEEALTSYVAFEFIGTLLRLPLLKHIAGISIGQFCKNVFLRVAVPFAVLVATCYICRFSISNDYRFLISAAFGIMTGSIAMFLTTLDHNEKQFLLSIMQRNV